MSQASPTAATRATSSPSGASGAAATPQHRRSRLPGRLQARRVLDLAAREKSARIGIGTALLDALACTALFFAAGAAAESAFLHQQDAPRYEWDTSLLDVIVVAAVRAAVSAACWRLAIRYGSAEPSKYGRNSGPLLLRLTAQLVPLICMGHAMAKLIYFVYVDDSAELHHSHTWRAMAISLASVSLGFSLIEMVLAMQLGTYVRRTRTAVLLMSGVLSINDEGELIDHSAAPEKKPPRVNLSRLASLARPHVALMLFGCAALLVSSGSVIVAPYYFGKVIDAAVNDHGDKHLLGREVIILGIIYIVGSVASFLRAWLFTLAGQRLVAGLRTDVFRAIIRQDIAFFDNNRTGELTNRLASDTAVIQSSLTINISMLLRSLVQIVGSLALMFWLSWQLTLVLLSVVPAVAIGAVYYGRKVRKLQKKFQDALAAASAVAEETISSMRTVRSFSSENKNIDNYATAIDKSYNIGSVLSMVQGVFAGATAAVGQLAVLLVLWYGALQVQRGHLTSGLLAGFMMYALQIAIMFATLSSLFGDLMSAVGASERLFQLMDKKPDIGIDGGIVPANFEPEIELDNVSFRYPSRPDTLVLRNASLKVPRGSVVALVGPSGGGKSTIVALIERFYDAEQGSVKVGGVPVKDVDPRWLHKHVAMVGQEPVLFALSVGDNIRYGKPDATMAEIEAAARQANAHDFVVAFEKGYDTLVGERGVRLSGGQKQRIAIARALLMNPEILLLDEATSALDAESEALVQEAIDRAMEGRTVLVIAHRLSTVRDANEVLVIDKGRICERGTHNELLRLNGVYRRLVERQLQMVDDGPANLSGAPDGNGDNATESSA